MTSGVFNAAVIIGDVATPEYAFPGTPTALREGRLTDAAVAALAAVTGFAVVGDYALLAAEPVRTLSRAITIALLPPHPSPGVPTAEQIVSGWNRGFGTHAVVHPEDLPRLDGLLTDRRLARERAVRAHDDTWRLVQGVAPDYADLLLHDGVLNPEIVPIVRDFPTPRTLASAGVARLKRALQEHPARPASQTLQALTDLISASRPKVDLDLLRHAEAVVPGRVDEYMAAVALITQIDAQIYLTLARTASGSEVTAPDRDALLSSVVLALASAASSEDDRTLGEILEQIDEARASLYIAGSELDRAYTRYLNARRLLTLKGFPLTPAQQLDATLTGQMLAIAAGDLDEAVALCAEAVSILQNTDAASAPAPLVADAALVTALAQFHTSDTVTGIAHLRAALARDDAVLATPAIYAEASGLIALMLHIFGRTEPGDEALRCVDQTIEAHRVLRSGRAPRDIAHLLAQVSRPDVDCGLLSTLTKAAVTHSVGTAYASYLHYVSILASLIDRDLDRGIQAYESIRLERRWPRHNPGFAQLARILYAALLAARGQVSAARSELAEIRTGQTGLDGADTALYHLVTCRLDLISNRFDDVLHDTSARGPLDERHLRNMNVARYLPAMLIIRGSAIAGTGSVGAAHQLFRRAIDEAATHQDVFALCAAETPEFRAWLEQLSADDLSTAVSRNVRTTLLSRPLLIGHGLPLLTAQQTRILRYLALGWTTSAIADALHVSGNTIKTHLRRLYERLGVNSRDQAVRAAQSAGLVH